MAHSSTPKPNSQIIPEYLPQIVLFTANIIKKKQQNNANTPRKNNIFSGKKMKANLFLILFAFVFNRFMIALFRL